MDSNRWLRLKELFNEAMDADDLNMHAFLARVEKEDPGLRTELEVMLYTHDESQALAIEGHLLGQSDPVNVEAEDMIGVRVGAFEIEKLIGTGGMGEVFLARRADGRFDQEVAIKLLRAGLKSVNMIRRFRVERHILARLTHPNIARLLDGGMTEDGRPYLITEYVEGIPISTFCDHNKLLISERLELFNQVCEAVQFAHQNLVVHRDLKPTNILVTKEGMVKLLDFGIAKLLNPDDEQISLIETRPEMRIMTPEYAAPEQVQGQAITTATDVYALGVLLYELLVGVRPYQFKSRLQHEISRVICEVEPQRPSTVISEVSDKDETRPRSIQISEGRRTRIGRLRKLLKGDLDNIIMMSLRKSPERRYASVDHLASDLKRYLSGQPVLAQKDTFGYRFGKFIRRHRLPVAITALFLVMLIGFTGTTIWQAQRISKERDAAETERNTSDQVVQVLVDLFEMSNPEKVPGGDTLRVGSFLQQAEAKMIESLDDQPLVQTKMKHVLGSMYYVRGELDNARDLYEQALKQQHELKGPDDPLSATISHDIARLVLTAGSPKEAEPLLRESLNNLREIHGNQSEQVLNAIQDFTWALENSEEKEALLYEALGLLEELFPDDDVQLARWLNTIGSYHFGKGEYIDALERFSEALPYVSRAQGPDHPHTLAVVSNIAASYTANAEYDEALEMQHRVLESQRRVLGLDNVQVANTIGNLATTHGQKGGYEEAERLFKEAIDLWRKVVGNEHHRLGTDLRSLSIIMQLQEKYEDAVPYMEEALSIIGATQGLESIAYGYTLGIKGTLMLDLGKPFEALEFTRKGHEIIVALAPPEGSYALSDAQAVLARALIEVDSIEQAISLSEQALNFRLATLSENHPTVAANKILLGIACARSGDPERAHALIADNIDTFKAWGSAHPGLVRLAISTLEELSL